ncbi:MerR family transcriptional regulator [Streptomyces sp. ICBB 8177]|uniref:MerR family transcriptional regulator n=1 Tax=Streptomyces sp. ICBB 8177 TaxID=563922 RepID=UPI000D67AEB5|nr:MerR family transcriptional regulator [Streptomyces sp. ICBB 8177]PWI43167.1 MerR family transcriptional regulator [Streptomyces sp. ICBB 8177]
MTVVDTAMATAHRAEAVRHSATAGATSGDPIRDCATTARPARRPAGRDGYTISEVVSYTGLSAHTLRWYERIGLMPHIDRSHTGQRRYSEADLGWLDFVNKLRLTGMPVADMVRYAELVREGEHTYPDRLQLLVAHREDVRRRIAELGDTLGVIDRKIDLYASAPTGAGEVRNP